MLCLTKYLTMPHPSANFIPMADAKRCRATRVRPAGAIAQGAALDDLRYIRQTLENSASFTAVPGWGMVGMAATALVAAAVAWRQPGFEGWMAVWLGEAVVALTLAMWAMRRKAQRAQVPLLSGPGRRFLLNFLPPMLVGGVLTAALYRAGSLQRHPRHVAAAVRHGRGERRRVFGAHRAGDGQLLHDRRRGWRCWPRRRGPRPSCWPGSAACIWCSA